VQLISAFFKQDNPESAKKATGLVTLNFGGSTRRGLLQGSDHEEKDDEVTDANIKVTVGLVGGKAGEDELDGTVSSILAMTASAMLIGGGAISGLGL
jgi:hypothetical protein